MSRKPTKTSKTSKMRRITLERTYQASPQKVWDLWTTKDGIESCCCPHGFRVKRLHVVRARGPGLL